MSEKPTDTRARILAFLDAELAKCEAATEGPWDAGRLASGVRHLERNCDWYMEGLFDANLPGRQGGDGGQADGDFIASARTSLPLVLRALRGEVEAHGTVPPLPGIHNECAACKWISGREVCPSLRRIASTLGMSE